MRSWSPFVCAAALLASAPGCFFGKLDHDVDRTPTMDAGVGGSILMPGASAPVLAPGGGVAPGGTTRTGPQGETSHVQGGAPASGAPLSMIGGSQVDEEKHLSAREEPVWWKYVTLPFALAAAPFKLAADTVRGDDAPEPGPAVPEQAPQQAPTARPQPATDYETARVNELEQELDRRNAAASAAAPAGRAATPSIADELAALQRVPGRAAPAADPAPAPGTDAAGPSPEPLAHPRSPAPPPPALGVSSEQPADGIVDRNGDGRVDLWIYRTGGEIVRRVADEDFDGRPDRSIVYDPATQQIVRIEEDTDQDGATDAWTDYQDGVILRRRADTNHDGAVDTWTFYQGGQIVRHEQDSTGSGFRDRVGFYEGGRLARDEVDSNGDGRPDVFNAYDDREEVVERREDVDFDGRIDRVSHFDQGRLARREILDVETR